MGVFKVIKKTKLSEMQIDEQLPESDFGCAVSDGTFVQFKYHDEENKKSPTIVMPGIWSISKSSQKEDGLGLFPTEFTEEKIMPEFCNTKGITTRIDQFFSNLKVYEKHGVFPKRGMLLYGPPGCHAKGTGILMVNGDIKKVEDVVIGDQLMGPDSKPRKVLELARNRQEMVRIIPTKGESFIVNKDHILHLTPSGETSIKTPINIRVSDYIKESKCFQERYKLTRVGVDFDEKKLIIPPYILGAWLGDGTSATSSLTSMDKEIVGEWYNYSESIGMQINVIESFKPSKAKRYDITSGTSTGIKHRNVMLNDLNKYNLINNKHIPNDYLTSSKRQRLELLAGLIDTDGALSSQSTFDYITKSEMLAKNIQFLCRSLGLAAYIKKCNKSCQYKHHKFIGEYYRLSISGDCDQVPVRLERKKALPRKQIKSVLRTGFTYELLPEDDYYGFSLNQDHLYLTSDFTIHHNTGKSTSIKIICQKYAAKGDTAVVLWPTDKYGASDVKDFIKTFEYHNVNRFILIAEDLGGVEVDQVKMESRSSLLSLLDNQEKTFKIPTLIVATTNHAEIFQSSLTNRPGRFSDKIEVGFPKAEARRELFKFFLKEKATEELLDLIKEKKFEEITPAHIQEVIIRSDLYSLSIQDSLNEIAHEIKQFKNLFQTKRQIGIDNDYDY